MMDIELTREIIACLPEGKTRFSYFRDRYAALMLPWLVADGELLSEVKRSRYAPLLEKAPVKEALRRCGNGRFKASGMALAWAEPSEHYLLTLGTWSEQRCWSQTSRHSHNLVLQVNFHDGYRKLFDKNVDEKFEFWFRRRGHPVLSPRENGFYRHTMGWVRMDIDFATGEAVIEEIQTDWIKGCKRALAFSQRGFRAQRPEHLKLAEYCSYVLERAGSLWAETLLSAALFFLREEMGIKTVWYHTCESGARLKRIRYTQPPKSMYSSLPRKFCFQQCNEHPEFLMRTRGYRRGLGKLPPIHWFRLVLCHAAGRG